MVMYLDHVEVEGYALDSKVVAKLVGYFNGDEVDSEVDLGTVEMSLAQWDALRDWAWRLNLGEEPRFEDEAVLPVRLVST